MICTAEVQSNDQTAATTRQSSLYGCLYVEFIAASAATAVAWIGCNSKHNAGKRNPLSRICLRIA
eukprot:8861-Heterococcus_DN1.PRE.2